MTETNDTTIQNESTDPERAPVPIYIGGAHVGDIRYVERNAGWCWYSDPIDQGGLKLGAHVWCTAEKTRQDVTECMVAFKVGFNAGRQDAKHRLSKLAAKLHDACSNVRSEALAIPGYSAAVEFDRLTDSLRAAASEYERG